jgi:hypothetical protein
LRRAFTRIGDLVVFQLNTAVDKRTDELQHSLVLDSCRQSAHEPVVVYAIKELGAVDTGRSALVLCIGTLTRLRLGAKAMSGQTSLQRTDHQSPERHHPFPAGKFKSAPKPEQTENPNCKKPLFLPASGSGEAPAMPKTKLKNQG